MFYLQAETLHLSNFDFVRRKSQIAVRNRMMFSISRQSKEKEISPDVETVRDLIFHRSID